MEAAMTSEAEKLVELAERCEQETGPDRELDRIIRDAMFQPCMNNGADYTASLDAAMTLVPGGASIDLRTAQTRAGAVAMVHPPQMRPTIICRAATPALALCAAALRARAALQPFTSP
jgi:hypothetical protein